jgi:chemosensory pili system protein ChpA (sensor histidine kinase/response regulator)
MDVVNSEVKQLGGSLHIDSRTAEGSVFTIRLPFTLSITQALLVKAGEETYCIPLASIEGVVRLPASDIAAFYADSNLMYEYAGYEYKLMNLGVLLGHGTPMDVDSGSRIPVLLYRSGEKRIALHVDELIGNREIVVKSVGKQLSTVQCVSGATILGDGRVSMILDIPALARTALQSEPVKAVDSADDSSRKLSIMVVDDSITVRRVTTRLLERNGINVITAKDGVEALAQLQESIPDIMLLDIEMPRMDGFELATHMRNDRRLMHIPVIMITSRMGYKHKQRAMEIGVDRYLGKPYQEHDLLDNIYRLLEEEQV